MTTTGVVLSVSQVTFGDELTVAASIGATVLTVDDAVDFDPAGGTVSVNGQIVSYTTANADSDTQTVTLAAGLTANAAVGDRVDVWDASLPGPAVEYQATVTLNDTDGLDDGDAVIAIVDHALVPLLPLGIRDPGAGESVTIEQRAGQFWVSNVNGSTPQIQGSYVAPGTIGPAALSFTAGGTKVTFAATAPASPAVGDIWFDTSNGNAMHRWDGSTWAAVTIDAAQLLTAGTIAANLLDAVLVLASTIIVGDPAGSNVKIDPADGITATDDTGDVRTYIGADGSAAFYGESLDADYITGTSLSLSGGSGDGGVFVYGGDITPLNANPDFATGITNWTGDSGVTISYSGTPYTYNGHNVLKVGTAPSSIIGVQSEDVAVTVGQSHKAFALLRAQAGGAPVYVSIVWLNSSHAVLSRSNGNAVTLTGSDWQSAQANGIAPAGAAFAHIHIANSRATNTPFYVATSYVGESETFSSLTNWAGFDDYGNSIPVGLRTGHVTTTGGIDAGGPISAPNVGGVLLATTTTAQSLTSGTEAHLTSFAMSSLNTLGGAIGGTTAGAWTVTAAGWYVVSAGVKFSTSNAGVRRISVWKNDAAITPMQSITQSGLTSSFDGLNFASMPIQCAVGDTLGIAGFQDSGAGLNVTDRWYCIQKVA